MLNVFRLSVPNASIDELLCLCLTLFCVVWQVHLFYKCMCFKYLHPELHSAQLMLLLCYHMRLRVISESPELRLEGGRVNHSWCIGVLSRSYVGVGRGRDGVAAGRHAVQSQEGLVTCRRMPEHFPSARWRH